MAIGLDRLLSARVAVVGDLMIDVYVQGEVERISPEAPVPVIRMASERRAPGGAANVAANIASLGGSVLLVGVAGDDEGFAHLRQALERYPNVDISGVLASADRPTTSKMRVIGHHQQIARIDREDTRPLPPTLADQIAMRATHAAESTKVLVCSDYGKGLFSDAVLQRLLGAGRSRESLIIVDPKRSDWSGYRGATIITPNRHELSIATGLPCNSDAEIVTAARKAHEISGADILVTRSERGMSFAPRSGEVLHLPTTAREVFDVAGAGDTAVAVLAVGLASGMSISEAMVLANQAAGIVVRKIGTAVVTREELGSALAETNDGLDVRDGRLMSLAELVDQRRSWGARQLSVGLANGCFDLLHPGHVSLIAQAASACDRLIVALNSDASMRRLKGPFRPIQSQAARAEVMGALRGVAACIVFDTDTPLELISQLQPDLLVKGADYREDEVVGADIVRERGGRVLFAPLREEQSTSRLIAQSLEYARGK